MGVLSSFSIAKKVTEEDIKKYFSKQKKGGKTDSEIQSLLKEKIMTEIATAIQTNAVPGLITPQELAKDIGLDGKVVKNVPELNRLVAVIVSKLTEKNYDRMSLCYFINSLVNLLGLKEEDFEKFHRGDEDDGDDEFKDA
jgi:hypothetical protein